MDEFLAFKVYEQMFGEVEARLVSERFDFITDPDASKEFMDPQSANKFLREIDPMYFRQKLMGIDPESILREGDLGSAFIERGLLDLKDDPRMMQDGGAVAPNFVSRIMDPKSPMTKDNAMVQLMDFSVDGRFFVAPTVFPLDSPVAPVLTKFSPDMAIRKAFNTGEFLEFDTAEQAKEFAIRFTDVINVEDRPKQNLKDGIAKFIPMMQ